MSEESEDFLVTSLARRDWLVDGPLSPLVAPYVRQLRKQRYADNTIRAYLKSIAHFAYWGGVQHVRLSSINESLIDRFVHGHLPVCDCPAPRQRRVINVRPALKHLVVVLRQEGYPCKVPPSSTPASREIAKFRHYLLDTCGFAESTTVYYRLKHVADFLARQFGTGTVDIGRVTPANIEECVTDYSKRWRPPALGVIRKNR